jgi:hypothetical protein
VLWPDPAERIRFKSRKKALLFEKRSKNFLIMLSLAALKAGVQLVASNLPFCLSAARLIPGCDESCSYPSRRVDAANRRKQAALFLQKEPKNFCL